MISENKKHHNTFCLPTNNSIGLYQKWMTRPAAGPLKS